MTTKVGKISKPFLIWTIILVIFGFFIFSSASLGVLAKDEVKFSNVALSQLFYGLFLGSIACVFLTRIDYHLWKKYSFYFFVGSILLTLLVFVDGLNISHGGAKRWIDLRFISFQPSEFLKIGFIVYFSAWLSSIKTKVETFKWGLLPFAIFMSIIGIILLLQPDTDTFAVILFASLSMYIASGAKWKHIISIIIAGIAIISILAITRGYVMERIKSMIDPKANSQTSGYQLQQSLIAVGSGQLFGRGFGQSIQKFEYLPEPIGDSIFAVAGEEFGFLGTVIIVGLFVMFGISGMKIAQKAPDDFGRLLTLGIVILIVSQAMINIGGMIGVLPLMGIPLPFISHGGTALFITFVEVGVIMNISRQAKK